MEVRNRLVIAIVLLLSSLCAAMAQTERRVALVIGNASYVNFGKLKNPDNDSRVMAATLRRLGFDVIEQENDSRRAMIQATRSFAEKLSPGGVGLFYYAGHGIQSQGANYLVPTDAALAVEDDLKYETLDVQDVLNKLDEARVRLSIVILDACRDNPFKSFRSRTTGLASINPPTGTVIVYATAPGKVADDGAGDHSVFTAELLKAMIKPDKLLDVFASVTEAVERRTGNRQTPWINSSFRGDFYFTEPVAVVVPAAPEPLPPAAAVAVMSPEIVFWQSIAGSGNPADFEAYLQQFPQGSFVALARIRLASLVSRAAPAAKQTKADDVTDTRIGRPLSGDGTKSGVKPSSAGAERSREHSGTFLATTPEAPRVPPAKPPTTVADIGQSQRTVAPPIRPSPPPQAPPTQEATIVRPPNQPDAAPTPPPSAVEPRPAAPTLRRFCNVSGFTGIETGAGGYAAISVANTGARCGGRLYHDRRGTPYDSLTVSKAPLHGSVTFEGSAFYYTPSAGFTGRDEFSVETSPWGHFRAVVDVIPGVPQ